MSCYVDPLFFFQARSPQAFRVGVTHGHMWSHLWADSLEELHAMAGKVGMRREWFQDKPGFPHYDLVPPRRAQAVELGAVEFSLADWQRGKRPETAGQLGFFGFFGLIKSGETGENGPEIILP